MAFPIIALIGSILGRKKDKTKPFEMGGGSKYGSIGESTGGDVAPGQQRFSTGQTGQYSNSNPAEVQQGQVRQLNQSGTGYGNIGDSVGRSGGGAQDAMGKVGNAVGLLSSLRKKKQNNAPYQMKWRG